MIVENNTWNFVYNDDRGLSNNINRLISVIGFKNLELITEDDFDPNNLQSYYDKKFNITGVIMLGDVVSLRTNLIEAYKIILDRLETLITSSESEETKMHELHKSRIYLKEFFVKFNLHKPGTLEGTFVSRLHNFGQMNSIDIRFAQWDLSQKAYSELRQHQQVRYDYMELLDSQLALELEKLYIRPLVAKIENESRNDEKEKQLLEVWVALKESGFINYLGENNSAIAQHRQSFFELFNLTDRYYKDRNKHLKITKEKRAVFLKHLTSLIENYSK